MPTTKNQGLIPRVSGTVVALTVTPPSQSFMPDSGP